MSAIGAVKGYHFGQKNNWRRTAWNEILRRTCGRERREFVIYLAGPEDHDRTIATQKGVPSENMVAVDRDSSNVSSLRKAKRPALRSDALDLLWSWPTTKPVCVIHLDFCSGLEMSHLALSDALRRPPLNSSIVCVNFQRGRDASSNWVRENFADLLGGEGFPEPIHRAYQFLAVCAACAYDSNYNFTMGVGKAWEDGRESVYGMPIETAVQQSMALAATFLYCPGKPKPGRVAVSDLIRAMSPRWFSYRSNSGQLRFDSVVFQPLTCGGNQSERVAVQRRVDTVARKVSAMLAVRTKTLGARSET